MHGPWEFVAADSTPQTVVWRCTRCAAVVGFARAGAGVGEPSATETEHPENIHQYANRDCTE
jgi:hypothetical protein